MKDPKRPVTEPPGQPPLVTVPVRALGALALAVDRLDWLCAECHVHPDHIDPTSLFDALSDVYAASRSLLTHTRTTAQ
jgi:hypothetical protein